MAWDKKVPFDEDGNMIGYHDGYSVTSPRKYVDGEWRQGGPIQWREVYTFDVPLVYAGYEQGRSRFTILLESEADGARYQMPMHEFNAMLLSGERFDMDSPGNRPEFRGPWTFVKRGANYRLVMAQVEEPAVTPDSGEPLTRISAADLFTHLDMQSTSYVAPALWPKFGSEPWSGLAKNISGALDESVKRQRMPEGLPTDCAQTH